MRIELQCVSVLFNEPKLLKCLIRFIPMQDRWRFSALQRAEIAEILHRLNLIIVSPGFSALQRAEIAEMLHTTNIARHARPVSVLFNEPKLLKSFVGVLALAIGVTLFQCSSTSRNC